MPYVVGNARVGRDNRAAGSPAGRENMVAGTFSPPPLKPMETGEYGAAISATIARTANTATVTATAHGLAVGERVRIIGATQLEYNGEFRVETATDANTFTYTVYGEPADPATGTITMREVRSLVGD